MLRRVRFQSASLLTVLLVPTAAMLAICLLALVEIMNTAQAASLPQNGKIAFVRFAAEGYEIYAVEPDGSNLSRLTHRRRVEGYETYKPAWSPDGTKIAFGSGQIWVMVADGSNVREVLPNRFRQYQGDEAHHTSGATWSPGGTKLAFQRGGELPYLVDDIYVTDLDGSNVVNLTQTPILSEQEPDFSPDGSKICFTLQSESREVARIAGADSIPKSALGIYVMNADGSDPTLLAGKRSGGCDWSPDGTKIAFYSGDDPGHQDVYVMNADGSEQTNITRSTSEANFYPTWSPDGTRIAFESSRDGGSGIYTMKPDGSDVTQLTTTLGGDYEPTWQPLPAPTIHPPDTGGPSLLLMVIALLFSAGFLFHTVVKRWM
jgi:Tol biopolymer transport system component